MKEVIKKWSKNPQSLVDKINENRGNCFLVAARGDERFYPKTVYGAELRFEKYVHLNLSGGNLLPIFEDIDTVEFRLPH